MRKEYTICIIGNPNCGKTTTFNCLTGQTQITGNWAGVTVDTHSSILKLDGLEIECVDLPGIYFLSYSDEELSADEKLTIDFLANAEYDLILNVIDASNLKRHLYLTTQLAEMGKPIVIAFNMMDKLKQEAQANTLKQFAGLHIVYISAKKSAGIEDLVHLLAKELRQPSAYPDIVDSYTEDVKDVVKKALISLQHQNESASPYQAIQLLETMHIGDAQSTTIPGILDESANLLEEKYGQDMNMVLLAARYQFINSALESGYKAPKQSYISDAIDGILLHKFLGCISFMLIMYLLFTFSITFGSFFQSYFAVAGQFLFIDSVESMLSHFQINSVITSLITQGIGGAIQTVISFIPVITGLYIFLSFLEESGYMARAAFLMNNWMNKLGLPGKAIIPLIIGFGCNVPAIISARMMDSKQHKLLVIMMSPFMSCSARLSVFTIFASTFFADNGQNIVFALYLIGVLFALFTAYVIKKSFGNDFHSSYLIIELPEYEFPSLASIISKTYYRLRDFVIGAGKLIIVVCFILHLMNSITTDGSMIQHSPTPHSDSILSAFSKQVAPIFTPMGIQSDNWPAVVGIFSGLLAKEVVVGTLNSLYSTLAVEQPYENAHSIMHNKFGSKSAAFAYLLFILLYFPCISVFAVMKQEIGLKWAVVSSIWSTTLAYSISVIFYQAANYFTAIEHSIYYMLLASALFIFAVFLLSKNAKLG